MKFGLNKKSNGKKSSAGGGSTIAAKASADAAAESESPMDVVLLERLVKLMAANDLNTVDVRDGDKRVILKRGPAGVLMAPGHTAVLPASAPSPQTSGSGTASVGTATSEEPALVAIKSPMVGTFYASPSPDAKPFVSVGSAIDDETDVCV